jgi:hypothetical protein
LERAPGWWVVKRLQKLGWCFLGVQLRGRDLTKPTFAECARVLRKFPNARLFLKLLPLRIPQQLKLHHLPASTRAGSVVSILHHLSRRE